MEATSSVMGPRSRSGRNTSRSLVTMMAEKASAAAAAAAMSGSPASVLKTQAR